MELCGVQETSLGTRHRSAINGSALHCTALSLSFMGRLSAEADNLIAMLGMCVLFCCRTGEQLFSQECDRETVVERRRERNIDLREEER